MMVRHLERLLKWHFYNKTNGAPKGEKKDIHTKWVSNRSSNLVSSLGSFSEEGGYYKDNVDHLCSGIHHDHNN